MVLILKSHAPRKIKKYFKVRFGLPRWLNRFVRDMHCPVDVREASRFLTPGCSWQNYIGDLSCFGEEDVLDDDEQIFLGKEFTNAMKIGKRDKRIGAVNPKDGDAPFVDMA